MCLVPQSMKISCHCPRAKVSRAGWDRGYSGYYCHCQRPWLHHRHHRWHLKVNLNFLIFILSSELGARQAQREVVKIKFFDFAYWAWSTPWGHVLSPITFCRNPVLSWAIRYSVFQKVKFTSNFEFVCGNLFSTFWHLMVKFGYIRWF